MCPVHVHKKTHNKHPYFSLSLVQHTPPWSVPCGLSELLAPPLQCSPFALLSYFTDLTDNYRPRNSTNRNIPLSRPPSAGCQRSEIVLAYPGPLLFKLSTHGRRLTSTRLLKTVSADRHKERGVNVLALKNLPHTQLEQYPVNGNTWIFWVGRLIIGVVWLLAEASWLHLLTLISQSRARPHLIAPQNRQGA